MIDTFPRWVPSLVREDAERSFAILHAGRLSAAQKAISVSRLTRFATDARMRFVWREFTKRRRDTELTFVNRPAGSLEALCLEFNEAVYSQMRTLNQQGRPYSQQELTIGGKDRDELRQELAAWKLFKEVVRLTVFSTPKLLTFAEIRKRAAPFKALAPSLQEAAKLLSESRPGSAHVKTLEHLAESFAATDWVRPWENVYVVPNNKNDRDRRAYTLAAREAVSLTWGTASYGTVARLASVALNTEVSSDQAKSTMHAADKAPVAFWCPVPSKADGYL